MRPFQLHGISKNLYFFLLFPTIIPEENKNMIISFGEILLDTFTDKNKKVQSFVGGAPFNVAYQVHRMGNDVLFVGNIGKDEAGKKIQKFFSDNGLSEEGLHIDKERKTTISKVELKNGERTFTFERENAADPYFDDGTLDFISEGDVIHVGSLMLSLKEGRDFASQIISFAKSQKKTLSFDVNYREDIFRDKKEAVEIYEKFYPQFDIVKFSKDELEFFTGEYDVETALRKLKKGPKLILVTLGKEGSLAYCNDRITKEKSFRVNSIDSTGAGDAFLGTFLSEVDSIGLREITFLSSLLQSSLKFSNIAGALATTKKGAVPSIASYKEVNAFLEKQTFQR